MPLRGRESENRSNSERTGKEDCDITVWNQRSTRKVWARVNSVFLYCDSHHTARSHVKEKKQTGIRLTHSFAILLLWNFFPSFSYPPFQGR